MAANGVSLNVHDHGNALDEQKRRVQCKYCTKVVSGFSRLKCHLGGIRGDVAPCNVVPAEVKEMMRKEIHEKKKGHLSNEVGELLHPDLPWKRNWSNESDGVERNRQETAQAGGSGVAKRIKAGLASETTGTESVPLPGGPEDLSTWHFQKCVGRFFFETGTNFLAAKAPSFEKMMNAALTSGQIGCKIPTPHELKGWILQDTVKEMQTYIKEIRDSWPSTGCSILLDGWTDGKGRELVNILVDCPKGVVYLRSLDISTSVGNVDALELLFDEILKEVGVDNVVQIVAHSISASMETVGKQLMDKHRTLFWTVSASHCIELMFENFGKMDAIKEVLEMAKTITKFVHGRAAVLKLLEDYNCGGLFKPSKFRSARPFLTLENIVSKKDNLMKTFLSLDWNTSNWASEREGKRVADLIMNRSFWTGATIVLKATTPLMRVLELISEGGTDKQRLGYIYETMDQAKETIKEEFKNKKSQYMPFWEEIDHIWNTYLHSPLHSAGYFLNPSLFYSSDFYTDPEVVSGLLCCIVRMAQYRNVQDLISLQVDEYREAIGGFGQGCAAHRRSNVPPATWWSNYGGQCPELQRLAIRILGQTCNGALKYGLKRDLAEELLTNGRNHMEQQRLSDLVFVHYNLHLRNFEMGTSNSIVLDEIDPMDDWIVEKEAQVIVSENGEPTGRGAHGEGPSSFLIWEI